MKAWLYERLADRVSGIRERYLRCRQKRGRLIAFAYLLLLNLGYYLLGMRHLGESLWFPAREARKLYWRGSESSLSYEESSQALTEKLLTYQAVSWDVFDTLLFRVFEDPGDVFAMVGMELGCPGFKEIRMKAEQRARQEAQRLRGTGEVTLEEIWIQVERETGIPREKGIDVEYRWEQKCCFPNRELLPVVWKLYRRGVQLAVASDMYLGEARVRELLQANGYPEFHQYLVSCDRGCSKWEGSLYKHLDSAGKKRAHLGDNPHSDGKQARLQGIDTFLLPNVNQAGEPYRTRDLSAVTGSLYRGLCNARIHSGLRCYSREYEYGFLYGGLFALGYCRFIHEQVRKKNLDILLFLSRDGYLLQKLYEKLYPGERTAYVCWSRLAALKITAEGFRAEYFRRFLFHKTGQGYSLNQILGSMELTEVLPDFTRETGISPEEKLTHRNVQNVKTYLTENWNRVLKAYQGQREAAEIYFRELLTDCHRAGAVDIGWAGSGPVMLDYAVNTLWNLKCPVTGILAGTLGAESLERDHWETYFLQGKLTSYLFSAGKNRDLWKFHSVQKGHNLYWELLLGEPAGSFQGFYPDGQFGYTIRRKAYTGDLGKHLEIHRGILDFVQCFLEAEKRLGIEIPISGRDAYAPMALAEASGNHRFFRQLMPLMDEANLN